MKAFAHIQAFLKDEEGASGIEYAMVAGMVAVAIVAFVKPINESITSIFENISDKLSEAVPKSGT